MHLLNHVVVCSRVNNQETNSANTSSQSPQLDTHPSFEGEAILRASRSGSGICAASQRHIRTEQKRRDRINDGCASQSEPLVCTRLHDSSQTGNSLLLPKGAGKIPHCDLCCLPVALPYCYISTCQRSSPWA